MWKLNKNYGVAYNALSYSNFNMVADQIIQQCISNNRVAQKQLYNSCAAYVYSIVKNYIYDDELRKDCMQEVFANIFNSLPNFNPLKGNFKSWIAQISINRSINFLKKHSKLKIDGNLEKIEDLSYDQFNYLDKLSRNEIENMLAKMPLGYRTVFLLYVIDDYSHKEIAETIGITAVTSRTQLSRALKWIKKNIIPSSNYLNYETF